MLRKPAPFYNQTYNSQSQRSIDQSSSAEYSYKKKSAHGQKDEREINQQQRQDYENNPTRRGVFNSNESYLVNETKVKRPVITDGNNPYTMGGASYKLERLSPYGAGQRNLSRQNVNSNKSANIPNQPNNNKTSQDLTNLIKPEHLVSFGNITNLNPSSHSSKKNHSYQGPAQKSVNKQNCQPNSEDSHAYDHPTNGNRFNKNNITKTSTNPSIRDHLLIKKPNQNDYLLPIVNTNTGNHSRQSSNSDIHNFHSNGLQDASSIASHNDSRISQADQSAYLKQKLIETHSKLIKQLEISKQFQDNFFELKKKYEQAVSLLNQHKSRQSEQTSQSKIKQLQLKQTLWNNQNLILTERVQQLVGENKCLKNELTQMSQNMSELILDNQSQKQKQHTFKYSSNDLKQCVNQEKAQFSQQLSQYNHEKAQYQQEVNKQANKIQQLKNDLENMRNRVLQMIKEKQAREQEIQSFNEEKNFLQNQLKVLQEKLSKKDKEFSQKQQLCEIWRKKYSEGQEQYQKVYESSIKLQKQAKQQKSLNHELNIALRQQKQKNAQMLSQIINIQMQTKQLKSKVSCLEQQRKTLQDKLFQNSQHKNMLQQKQQLEHNIQKLTHQYNSLSAIINKKDKQINDLSNQVIQKNTILHKMTIREKELQVKERELEKKQRDLHDHRISRITSVKDFVNKLEEDRERSVGMRRGGNNNGAGFGNNNNGQGQFANNMQNHGNYQMNSQHNMIRQNVLNVSSSMRLQSQNATPTRQLSPISHTNNNSKTPKQLAQNNQFNINQNFNNEPNNNQRSLTPSKSLSGLKVNSIDINKSQGGNNQNYQKNNQNNQNILICENGEEEQNEYEHCEEYVPQNYANQEQEQNFGGQGTRGNNIGQYESVQDSLQLVRMINKVSHPQSNTNNHFQNNYQANKVNSQSHNPNQDNTNHQCNGKTMATSKSAQQLHTNKQIPAPSSQSKPTNKQSSNSMTEQKQRKLSSYKQEKQQYLSLLEQIGQLETQNYNLNQEKKKIVEELDKIESAKTKTKEMIARRRQLELWLLGNQKKNNQVKEKLKIYRGKVM